MALFYIGHDIVLKSIITIKDTDDSKYFSSSQCMLNKYFVYINLLNTGHNPVRIEARKVK